jgi:hypothetical protein
VSRPIRCAVLAIATGCGPALPAEPPAGSPLARGTYEAPAPPLGTAFEDREVTEEGSGGGGHHHHHHQQPRDAGTETGGHAH